MGKATASTHRTEPWNCNAGPSRSINDAIEIAKSHGVKIPGWVEFNVYKNAVPRGAHASYGIGEWSGHARVRWEEFLNRRKKVPVHLRRYVFRSDEAIVAIIGHEIHEITELRALFRQNGGSMQASRVRDLISPKVLENLHWKAVDFADGLVRSMRDK